VIRCTISLEYGTLRYARFSDAEFVKRWNAQCDTLSFTDWKITDEDVAKAKAEGEKPTGYKWAHDITRSLSYEEMCEVGRLEGASVKFSPDESSMIVKLEERVRALSLRLSEIERPAALAQNAAAIVHVPDQALLYVDEVTYLSDECTDRLQDHLNEGWRILAVCPPCSQRRPDYILGRRKSQRPLPLAQIETDPFPEGVVLF
jgi:hypothetical protein